MRVDFDIHLIGLRAEISSAERALTTGGWFVSFLLRELREGKPGFCPFQTLDVGVIWGSLNQFTFSRINCRKMQTG